MAQNISTFQYLYADSYLQQVPQKSYSEMCDVTEETLDAPQHNLWMHDTNPASAQISTDATLLSPCENSKSGQVKCSQADPSIDNSKRNCTSEKDTTIDTPDVNTSKKQHGDAIDLADKKSPDGITPGKDTLQDHNMAIHSKSSPMSTFSGDENDGKHVSIDGKNGGVEFVKITNKIEFNRKGYNYNRRTSIGERKSKHENHSNPSANPLYLMDSSGSSETSSHGKDVHMYSPSSSSDMRSSLQLKKGSVHKESQRRGTSSRKKARHMVPHSPQLSHGSDNAFRQYEDAHDIVPMHPSMGSYTPADFMQGSYTNYSYGQPYQQPYQQTYQQPYQQPYRSCGHMQESRADPMQFNYVSGHSTPYMPMNAYTSSPPTAPAIASPSLAQIPWCELPMITLEGGTGRTMSVPGKQPVARPTPFSSPRMAGVRCMETPPGIHHSLGMTPMGYTSQMQYPTPPQEYSFKVGQPPQVVESLNRRRDFYGWPLERRPGPLHYTQALLEKYGKSSDEIHRITDTAMKQLTNGMRQIKDNFNKEFRMAKCTKGMKNSDKEDIPHHKRPIGAESVFRVALQDLLGTYPENATMLDCLEMYEKRIDEEATKRELSKKKKKKA